MNKVPLSEAKILGNLKTIQQVYRFNYMPQEEKYDPKIELAITLENQGIQQGAYRSLRFKTYAQLVGFLSHLSRAIAFYGRENNIISPSNFQYRLDGILRVVEEGFRGK